MNIKELYSKGVKACNLKNFDEALKIAKELQELAPHAIHGYYLEAKIWNKLNKLIKEFYANKKLLPLLKFSSLQEKDFASEILQNLGIICGSLSLYKEAYEFHRLEVNFID